MSVLPGQSCTSAVDEKRLIRIQLVELTKLYFSCSLCLGQATRPLLVPQQSFFLTRPKHVRVDVARSHPE